MAFLTDDELRNLGLKHFGKNVRVSDRASLHNASRISLDDHVRIDDFCVLSAGQGSISIGRYVHIGSHCILLGSDGIVMEDFSQLSNRVTVLTISDDFSGEFPPGATIPEKYRKADRGPVVFRPHSGAGAGTLIMPNVEIGFGSVIGALSLVKSSCDEFGIYAGVPARRVKERKKTFLDQIDRLLRDEESGDD
jgi:galactoside O-acetyltransferase